VNNHENESRPGNLDGWIHVPLEAVLLDVVTSGPPLQSREIFSGEYTTARVLMPPSHDDQRGKRQDNPSFQGCSQSPIMISRRAKIAATSVRTAFLSDVHFVSSGRFSGG